jgi:uncharacterized lipoprotein YddW (UPF0748 family)
MKQRLIFLVLFFMVYPALYADEPEEEFRAVWLTTFAGLDWPKSFDPDEQKRSLLAIIDSLYNANFNAILFQARSRGDAFYRSSFEPWARELTGITGEDPGWDPLAFLIEHARRRGMEVHAWVNVYKVWGGSPIPFDAEPRHILDRYPTWGRIYGNEWWLDPGEPGVHSFLLKVSLDLIEKYPLDGIHFDHIRYPGRDFDDAGTYLRFGHGENLHDWRRENISRFVREFYRLATAIRPDLKIGSAPIGVYKSLPGYNGSSAFVDYYQDVEGWLREGVHDYIVPQVYWNVANNPKFDTIIYDWKSRSHGRHVYGGIGIFRPEVYDELFLQLSITRSLEIPGQVYFRYAHLAGRRDLRSLYRNRLSVPSMPWVADRAVSFNSMPLLFAPSDTVASPDWIPTHLQYVLYHNNNGLDTLGKDSGASAPQRYIVYRSMMYPINTNNPEHLLAVLPATTASFNSEMYNPLSSGYYYLITELSDEESIGDDNDTSSVLSQPVRTVARLLGREIVLPCYSEANKPGKYNLCVYFPKGASGTIVIEDPITGREYTVVEGFLDSGMHTIPLTGFFIDDFMRCTLHVGGRKTDRYLSLPARRSN